MITPFLLASLLAYLHPLFPLPLMQLPNSLIQQSGSKLSFENALTQLSRKYHCCFVCDDIPQQPEVTGEIAETLTRLISDGVTPLERKVEQVAKTFGYTYSCRATNQYQLLKNYSNEEDLPNVSFDEVRRSFQNVMAIVKEFDSEDTAEDITDFYQSLNETQKQRMKEGISVTELSNSQQQLFLKLAWTFPLSGFDEIRRINNRLKRIKNPKTRFELKEFYGHVYPIYKGPFGLRQDEWMVVLGGWIMTGAGGATVFEGTPGKVELQGNRIITQETDPTTPNTKGNLVTSAPNDVFTMKSQIAKLQSSFAKQAGASSVNIKVDDCISMKRLLITGEEEIPSLEILQSIADIHHLRLVENPKGSFFLTIPNVRPLLDPNQLHYEVRRLIPVAFWRLIEQKLLAEEKSGKNTMPELSSGGNISPKQDHIQINDHALLKIVAMRAVYIPAVKRLRGLIEPILNRRPQTSVRMAEMSNEVHDLIAISSLATCTESLFNIPTKMPTYVAQFNQSHIALPEVRKSTTAPKSGGISFHIWCIPEGKTTGDHAMANVSGIDVN